jgi:hypothetical protein
MGCLITLRALLLARPALYDRSAELLPKGAVVVDVSAIELKEAQAAFMLTVLYTVYSAARARVEGHYCHRRG